MVRSVSASGEERAGKWWIDEGTDMRCLRWSDKREDFCRYTEKNQDGTHTLAHPKSGKKLVEIAGTLDGNQLGQLNARDGKWRARQDSNL